MSLTPVLESPAIANVLTRDGAMLDFLLELERVLKIWPDNVRWNLVQIAEQTRAKLPTVVEGLSEVLAKALDIHEPLTFNEVSKAHAQLMERHRSALDARRREEVAAARRAVDGLERAMEKVRVMVATKNWRNAYRTLSYFYGLHKDSLPSDSASLMCNECLHLGVKAGVNFQELSQWLRLGVQTLLAQGDHSSIEDALDMLDAYGDVFLQQAGARGETFLTNIFLALKPAAMEFNLTLRLNDVANELNLTKVLDIVA